MAILNFPVLPSGAKPDSSKFQMTLEDNVLSQEIEGGYTVTRPRTTRKARRSWKVAYTNIDNADRQALMNFYESAGGGGVIFNWVNPQDGATYLVRFKGDLPFQYMGYGDTQRWDCGFELQQA